MWRHLRQISNRLIEYEKVSVIGSCNREWAQIMRRMYNFARSRRSSDTMRELESPINAQRTRTGSLYPESCKKLGGSLLSAIPTLNLGNNRWTGKFMETNYRAMNLSRCQDCSVSSQQILIVHSWHKVFSDPWSHYFQVTSPISSGVDKIPMQV